MQKMWDSHLGGALALLPMLILILLAFPVGVQAGKGQKITSLPLTNPVTIDGKWTTIDEWTDGLIIQRGVNGRIALKDDSDFLYVLVDYIRDTRAAAYDFAWIVWDQKNDGGSKPRSDDYDLLMSYETESEYDVFFYKRTGTGWGNPEPASSLGVTGASSTDATNNPYSNAAHLVYEFRVPRLVLDNSTVITSIGFFAGAQNSADYSWIGVPQTGGDYRNPNTWAQLTFSVPVPEFSQTLLTMALLVATLSIMLRRKKSATP
jgi:hypothetical protein